MNRFKLQAYVKEFPFLSEVSRTIEREDAAKIDFIKIAKVDENLLNYIPRYDGSTGSMVDISSGENVIFVLNDGQIIDNAVITKSYITHNEAHYDDESWNGETIMEGIDKHEVAESLKYIVIKKYGYEIRDHYSIGGLSFTVYKVAKNETIKRIIENTRNKEIELVKAEANF